MSDTYNTISPSELAYLNGDQFAPKGGKLAGREPILGTDKDVAPRDLAVAALSAAVLALEQAGAFQLDEENKKRLFGLINTDVLHIELGTSHTAWPSGSLEYQLAKLALRANTVRDLVYALFPYNVSSPYSWINNLIREGLISWGLVKDEVTKHLKIFTSHQYTLPEATSHAVAANPPTTVQKLRSEIKSGRPHVWALLQREISSALAARVETSTAASSSMF